MTDAAQLLKAVERAHERFEETARAHTKAHEALVAAALDALRAGAEPGDVYARVPFTSTYMRTLAREAGIPGGRPGLKPTTKTVTRGRHARRSEGAKAARRELEEDGRRLDQAPHGDTSSPT